jgi:hypothetical protein
MKKASVQPPAFFSQYASFWQCRRRAAAAIYQRKWVVVADDHIARPW